MHSPLNKIRRYPIATGAVGVTLALLAIFFLRGNAVPGLEVREADLVAQVRLIESNAQSATGLSGDLDTVEATVEEIESRLFDREELAINTSFFYGLDDQLGAQVREVTQAGAETARRGDANKGLKTYSVITYNLSVAGSYAELVEFLGVVDSVSPFARVSSFELKQGSGAGGKNSINLNMKVEVLGRLES